MVTFNTAEDTPFWLEALRLYRERTGDLQDFWKLQPELQHNILRTASLLKSEKQNRD